MHVFLKAALLSALVFSAAPALASNEVPIREVESTLAIPSGMSTTEAMQSVDELDLIFARYEPVVPWVPGVQMSLDKQIVSTGPMVVQMPVDGSAFGHEIVETARVTATTTTIACEGVEGRQITLDFEASSYNIERRIDRIDITACPATDADGVTVLHTVGRMYAGYKPEDPELSALKEAVGARALETAFIKQVPAVLDAVEQHWAANDG